MEFDLTPRNWSFSFLPAAPSPADMRSSSPTREADRPVQFDDLFLPTFAFSAAGLTLHDALIASLTAAAPGPYPFLARQPALASDGLLVPQAQYLLAPLAPLTLSCGLGSLAAGPPPSLLHVDLSGEPLAAAGPAASPHGIGSRFRPLPAASPADSPLMEPGPLLFDSSPRVQSPEALASRAAPAAPAGWLQAGAVPPNLQQAAARLAAAEAAAVPPKRGPESPVDEAAGGGGKRRRSADSERAVTPPAAGGEEMDPDRLQLECRITLAQLATLFAQPASQAATRLGISASRLKRLARSLGVHRWPYRKVAAIERWTLVVRAMGLLRRAGRLDPVAVPRFREEALLQELRAARARVLREPGASAHALLKRLNKALLERPARRAGAAAADWSEGVLQGAAELAAAAGDGQLLADLQRALADLANGGGLNDDDDAAGDD